MQNADAATPPPVTDSPQPGTPQQATSNRSALFIVFLVVFIDLLGFGIVLPMLPRIADEYAAVLFPGQPSVVGLVVGLLMSSFSLMQFIFAPIYGRISDRIGRRPILLLGLAGSVVFYALFGLASTLPPERLAGLALTFFFIARIGAGMAGATIATAQAVIADCTPPDKRKHGMALIGAAFGIGFTFGPLIAYAALTVFSGHPEAIGYTAAVMSLIALVLGIRLLPETRRPDVAPVDRRWVDFAALGRALANPAIGPVIATFFLATLGFGAFEATLALLLKDAFGFAENSSFLFFAYVGFVLMLTQGVLYRRLAKRVSEVTFMALGILFMAAGVGSLGLMASLAAASTDVPATSLDIVEQRNLGLLWILFPALTFAVVGFAFLTPSAQALISRRTDAGQQGEVLGVNQSASALARILGPLSGVLLYKLTPSHMLPYAFGAVVLLVMLPMIPKIRRGGV